MMMAKDKGNHVFREVMKGTRDRTNTDAERRRNADLEARTKREADRLAKETKRINDMMERQRRAEAAHQRAEEDRRKRGK
jgi:hypothetical protein